MTTRSVWLGIAMALYVLAGEAAAEKLRIITYNIRQGKGQVELHTPEVDIKLPFGFRIHIDPKPIPLARGKGQLDKIAKAMQRCFPDILCLQEVNNRSVQTLGRDQASYLAEKMGMHYVYKTAHAEGKIVKRQGNAVLSKHPIAESRVVVLSKAQGDHEQRIALFARILVPGFPGGVWVCSTHLESGSNEIREQSVPRFIEAVRSMTGPVILTGDFNASPQAQSMKDLFAGFQAMDRPLTDAFAVAGSGPGETSSAPVGEYRIDYVLATAEFKPVHATSPRDINESDHFPVVVEFETAHSAGTTTAALDAPAEGSTALLGISMAR